MYRKFTAFYNVVYKENEISIRVSIKKTPFVTGITEYLLSDT